MLEQPRVNDVWDDGNVDFLIHEFPFAPNTLTGHW